MKKILFMLMVSAALCAGCFSDDPESNPVAFASLAECQSVSSTCDGDLVHSCMMLIEDGKLMFAWDSPVDCAASGLSCVDDASVNFIPSCQ